MKKFSPILLALALIFACPYSGSAHFGMLIPSSPAVTPDKRSVELNLSFSHPFEGVGMELVRPDKFYVVKEGEKADLRQSLKETEIMGHPGFQGRFQVKRPGVYHFVMEPTPYWEPTEDLSIIHYTKVIVPAFGGEDGWDRAVGLPTEIVPLLRPFGNYAGNSFTGRVLLNGEPAAGAEIEVEFYNREREFKAASDHHVTQVIKADDRGVFTFSCPLPGWWGFAALSTAGYTLKNPEGVEKPVERGAVIWVYMHPLVQ